MKKTTHKTSRKTRNGVSTSTRQRTKMDARDLEYKLAELQNNQPELQKERARQQGKTSRARAGAAGAIGVSANASQIEGDQTVIYQQMASGGFGTDDSSEMPVTKPRI